MLCLAIVQVFPSPSPTLIQQEGGTPDDLFTWDADRLSPQQQRRRSSCVSLGTIIICADDLQQEKEQQPHRLV